MRLMWLKWPNMRAWGHNENTCFDHLVLSSTLTWQTKMTIFYHVYFDVTNKNEVKCRPPQSSSHLRFDYTLDRMVSTGQSQFSLPIWIHLPAGYKCYFPLWSSVFSARDYFQLLLFLLLFLGFAGSLGCYLQKKVDQYSNGLHMECGEISE